MIIVLLFSDLYFNFFGAPPKEGELSWLTFGTENMGGISPKPGITCGTVRAVGVEKNTCLEQNYFLLFEVTGVGAFPFLFRFVSRTGEVLHAPRAELLSSLTV